MLRESRISISKAKQQIFIYGILNFALYVILFLILRWFNLLHFSGLRLLNYVTLFFISIYQIKHWIKETGGYIPSLQAFAVVFLTGTWSFVLLGAGVYAYSFLDPYITELYFNTYGKLNASISSFLIFFEGSSGSLIVGLVTMMYASRYQDGEVSI